MKTWQKSMMRAAAVVAVAVMGFAPSLRAQQAEPLKVTVENLTMAHDSVRLKSATRNALPNDTLRYVLTFTNLENRALRNVVFTNPVPAGLLLVPGTVTTSAGAKVEYSVDGGVTYAERPMVTVTENGRQVQRAATVESYTHIRWTVTDSVAPDARVTARYETRVSGIRR